MLLISTKLKNSDINGLGLFADQFVPKGTKIWELTPKFDIIYEEKDLSVLTEYGRKKFLHYCYQCGDKYVLCFDDARFINHSENPNTIDGANLEDPVFALQDIQIGEEILCNYKDYDNDWKRKLS